MSATNRGFLYFIIVLHMYCIVFQLEYDLKSAHVVSKYFYDISANVGNDVICRNKKNISKIIINATRYGLNRISLSVLHRIT